MAIISEQPNQRSLVALIACDQSYATELQLTADPLFPASGGTKLTSFADSSSPDNEPSAQMFSNADLISFADSFAGNPARGTGDWRLHAKHYDATTDFSALIFYSADKKEYVVSFTGTNGLSAGADWFTNLNYATTQWIANRTAIRTLLAEVMRDNATHATAHITFTGQSLGGALAQFAAYDYIKNSTLADRPKGKNVSLITFNGLGAFGGMRAMEGPDFVANALAGVETAHYIVYNDLISRLGEGNFNAEGNTFLLNFREEPGLTLAKDGVDAHRIESGFYRELNKVPFLDGPRGSNWSTFQTAALLHSIDYLEISGTPISVLSARSNW